MAGIETAGSSARQSAQRVMLRRLGNAKGMTTVSQCPQIQNGPELSLEAEMLC